MKILLISEVAERLRCSQWKVYQMIKDGSLMPLHHLGRPYRFDEAHVERLLTNARSLKISQGRSSKSLKPRENRSGNTKTWR